MEASDWINLGRLILTLGAEVLSAIREGQTTRTVGEIFDSVSSDLSELERLELARFGVDSEV